MREKMRTIKEKMDRGEKLTDEEQKLADDMRRRVPRFQEGHLQRNTALVRRLQDIAQRKANQQDTKDLESGLLPPMDTGWNAGQKKKTPMTTPCGASSAQGSQAER